MHQTATPVKTKKCCESNSNCKPKSNGMLTMLCGILELGYSIELSTFKDNENWLPLKKSYGNLSFGNLKERSRAS